MPFINAQHLNVLLKEETRETLLDLILQIHLPHMVFGNVGWKIFIKQSNSLHLVGTVLY